jgi:hypothetical protein
MYTLSEALALSVLCNIRATDHIEATKVYHHNMAAEIEVSEQDRYKWSTRGKYPAYKQTVPPFVSNNIPSGGWLSAGVRSGLGCKTAPNCGSYAFYASLCTDGG